MTTPELTKWLRENSSGVYRPAAEAADLIERMEKLFRQVLPEWADEVTEDQRHKPVGEITGNDVLMIRDFLANAIGEARADNAAPNHNQTR